MSGAPNTLVDFHTGVDYALSREEKNKKGGKMYIQDKARLPASVRRFDFDLR